MPSPYQRLNDPDWLRTEYLERGRTAADIATEVGCPHKTVDRALRRDDIREQYVQRERSIIDIAAEVGLSRTAVRRALEKAGIPIDTRRLPRELDDPEWLATQAGVTSAELARRLGISPDGGIASASTPRAPRRDCPYVQVPTARRPGLA